MTNEELLSRAKEGMKHSYAPYSKFNVGAALLCRDGTVFTGCNIENASYGAAICAERTAMTKAISEGHTDFEKIAVVCSSGSYAYPCGICRQFMSEFMLEGSVVLEDKAEGMKEFPVTELLPGAFTGKELFHE
ncbi:MAG: cytidine deaminase [Lachnospiraceae bacterium]|nr:cytidine deaminase [Lachnospiraceae bacterium]